MTMALVFALALGIGGYLALRPYLRPMPWPAEPPDRRDDVARAVSSIRDLEFAQAAGTIDPADAAVLRARIEASAFPTEAPAARPAPVATFAVAALVAALAAVLVVAFLPGAAGDRAPGSTITGSVPQIGQSLEELEASVRARPDDIPTRLALAEAYVAAQRADEAADQYRAVLTIDNANVPALNGVALLLYRSGSPDGALAASDRVLSLRPRDPDALFLKGLILYQMERFADAVAVWEVFLEVGEFHGAAPMVRSLYADARAKSGQK
jgi:cytochrome c-type biogenesis protein CcmH/NrfG